jgi:hypothetical protein
MDAYDFHDEQLSTKEALIGYYEHLLREAVTIARQIMTPMEIRRVVNEALEKNDDG